MPALEKRHAIAICAVIVLAGAVIRLVGLTDPPLDFHPTRQYRSAIIARSYSVDLLADVSPAQRQMAARAAEGLPPIEPPVMERLAAVAYHALGREDLAAARLIAVTAWALGAVAMMWLALQLLSPAGAVAAVAIMMFLPFGIAASRSFQPDPLMCALVVLSLAAAVRHLRRPGLRSAGLLMFAAGGALLVKAVAVFFLAAPLAVLIWFAEGSRSHKLGTAVLLALSAAPAAWYYARLPLATAYGPFFQLLDQRQFWVDWAAILGKVVTWPVLAVAVGGTLIAQRPVRELLGAALLSYIAFGVVFTHHIHTHDYYSLPLIPIVAVGAGAFVSELGRRTARVATAAASVIALACVFTGSVSVVEAQSSSRRASLRAEADRLARIGELVGHSEHLISLDGAYGLPLIYHGYVMTSNWPLSGDLAVLPLTGGSVSPAQTRLHGSGAEFFVCTIQPELDAQPDLSQLLAREHPLLARDGAPDRWAYLIYDLRRGRISTSPAELSLFGRAGRPDGFERSISLYAPAASRWTVEVDEASGLTVQPESGVGPATVRVRAATPVAPVDRASSVTFTSATEGPSVLDVRVRATQDPDRPPYGSVDSPPDPVTLGSGPILFQGWALDDLALVRVWVGYVGADGSVVHLAEARREGRRPDVAALYPTAPELSRSAWAVTLDLATLSRLPRSAELRFFAEDSAGHQSLIGQRRLK